MEGCMRAEPTPDLLTNLCLLIAQCWAHSKHLINIYWMSEKMNESTYKKLWPIETRITMKCSTQINSSLSNDLSSVLKLILLQMCAYEGDQPWDFFGRNDAKAETPVLWPPHAKSWLIGKDSDAGTDWGEEEKGTTEDQMAGWHHWLDGRESEWTPGVGDGQGGLACCDSWGREESDMTEWLIWSDEVYLFLAYLIMKTWVKIIPLKLYFSFSNKMERETKESFQTFSESHLYTSIPSNIWILEYSRGDKSQEQYQYSTSSEI